MRTKQTLTLLLGILLTTKIAAQITIGSLTAPLSGALLELKDEGTYSKGETASKGIGMPRVMLTKAKPTTAKELAESIGNTSGQEYDLDSHVGLVVYNGNSEGCRVDSDIYPPSSGLYVWTGEVWQGLSDVELDVRSIAYGTESVSPSGVTVGTFTMNYSSESERYYYADFGAAGVWMTQNLRTQYSPDGTLLSMTGSQNPDGNGADGKSQKVAAYPRAVNPTLSDYYKQNRDAGIEIGLLYDWYTAADHHNCSNVDQNQVGLWGDTPGASEVESKEPEKYIKGICPTGWHLPSDREWTGLMKVLTENANKYATNSYTVSQKTWNTAWESVLTNWSGSISGTVMRSATDPYMNGAYNSNGESRRAIDGGFDVLLAGYAEDGIGYNYASGGSFWTSSSFTNLTNRVALARGFNYSRVEYYRGAFNRKTFYSVRCKRN